MKIAVVGSGLIGQAWAIVFARGGHEVKMWDGDPKAVTLAFTLIEEQVADLEAAGASPRQQNEGTRCCGSGFANLHKPAQNSRIQSN